MTGVSAIGQAVGRGCPKFLAIHDKQYSNSLYYRGYDEDNLIDSDIPYIINVFLKKLFPNYATTTKELVEDVRILLPITNELIEKKTQTIFNPVADYNGHCWFADMIDLEENGYRIYGILEGTKLSDSILMELDYVRYIFESAGIKISGTSVIYLNSKYVVPENTRVYLHNYMTKIFLDEKFNADEEGLEKLLDSVVTRYLPKGICT